MVLYVSRVQNLRYFSFLVCVSSTCLICLLPKKMSPFTYTVYKGIKLLMWELLKNAQETGYEKHSLMAHHI